MTGHGQVNWDALGARLNRIQADMIHAEHSAFCGAAFTGESLRRLLGQCAEFVTTEQHERVVDANRHVDALRMSRRRYSSGMNARAEATLNTKNKAMAARACLRDSQKTITGHKR